MLAAPAAPAGAAIRMDMGRALPVVDDGAATAAMVLSAVTEMTAEAEEVVEIVVASKAATVALGPACT